MVMDYGYAPMRNANVTGSPRTRNKNGNNDRNINQMIGPGMNIFGMKKKFNVTERDPTYKVRYLGNIQTSLMRGEGCTDKAAGILWNNFLKNGGGLDMKLTICATGLKALTKEQGLTDYRAHRVSYCIAHPEYPRLFLWVYRHEGKRMKVELRCHAVLVRKVEKARAMALQLHDKISSALSEFVREKTRRQNARLALQRTKSLPTSTSHGADPVTLPTDQPLRRKLLSTAQNFKPPVDRSPSAPKLGAITETCEIIEEEEDEEELSDEEIIPSPHPRLTRAATEEAYYSDACSTHSDGDLHENINNHGLFDLELGNDLTALQNDAAVQFQVTRSQLSDDEDDNSSESGFSEHEAGGSACSTSSSGRGESEADHVTDHVTEEMSLCFLPSPENASSNHMIVVSSVL